MKIANPDDLANSEAKSCEVQGMSGTRYSVAEIPCLVILLQSVVDFGWKVLIAALPPSSVVAIARSRWLKMMIISVITVSIQLFGLLTCKPSLGEQADAEAAALVGFVSSN